MSDQTHRLRLSQFLLCVCGRTRVCTAGGSSPPASPSQTPSPGSAAPPLPRAQAAAMATSPFAGDSTHPGKGQWSTDQGVQQLSHHLQEASPGPPALPPASLVVRNLERQSEPRMGLAQWAGRRAAGAEPLWARPGLGPAHAEGLEALGRPRACRCPRSMADPGVSVGRSPVGTRSSTPHFGLPRELQNPAPDCLPGGRSPPGALSPALRADRVAGPPPAWPRTRGPARPAELCEPRAGCWLRSRRPPRRHRHRCARRCWLLPQGRWAASELSVRGKGCHRNRPPGRGGGRGSAGCWGSWET
uniref:Uncharacterized protein n=1 Tax=Myotis myotis TaxID=51298 RepID=A0A7J7T634_MYOMY|nr:hypothetical protein mMyoMyo1_009122 [Myotis myotis]